MVSESVMVTIESLYKTTIALLNGTIALMPPYDLSFPQMGFQHDMI